MRPKDIFQSLTLPFAASNFSHFWPPLNFVFDSSATRALDVALIEVGHATVSIDLQDSSKSIKIIIQIFVKVVKYDRLQRDPTEDNYGGIRRET